MREAFLEKEDCRLTGLTLTRAALERSEEEDRPVSGEDFCDCEESRPLESFISSFFDSLDGLVRTGAPCLGRLNRMSQFIRDSNCSEGSEVR